jgi:hypothetical protein
MNAETTKPDPRPKFQIITENILQITPEFLEDYKDGILERFTQLKNAGKLGNMTKVMDYAYTLNTIFAEYMGEDQNYDKNVKRYVRQLHKLLGDSDQGDPGGILNLCMLMRVLDYGEENWKDDNFGELSAIIRQRLVDTHYMVGPQKMAALGINTTAPQAVVS